MVLSVVGQMAALAPVAQTIQILRFQIVMLQMRRSQNDHAASNRVRLSVVNAAIRKCWRALTCVAGTGAHGSDHLLPVSRISLRVLGFDRHGGYAGYALKIGTVI